MLNNLINARLQAALLMTLLACGQTTILASEDQDNTIITIEEGLTEVTILPVISEYDIDDQWRLPDAPMSPTRQGIHNYFSGAEVAVIGAVKGISCIHSELFMGSFPRQTLSPEYQMRAEEVVIKLGGNPGNIKIIGATVPKDNVAAALGLDKLLIDPAQSEHSTQAEQEFIIAHEYAHLQQKHNLKHALVAMTLPFAVHYATKAWDCAVHRGIIAIKKTFKITKDTTLNSVLNKIDAINHWISTFCLTKGLLTGLANEAYSRHNERLADLAAVQALKASEGAVGVFEGMREKLKAARLVDPVHAFKYDENGDNKFPGTHPRISERIEYVRNYVHAG